MILLMESDYKRPVNLGNPDEYNMLQFAKMVIKKTGTSSGIIFQNLPEDDPKRRCPDISLAKKIIDWKPRIELTSGLDKTIEWYKAII